jgi:hypothetical protein
MRPDPDELQRWIRAGVPPGEVGGRLGLSRATGYAWLRRYGITEDGPEMFQDHLVGRWQAGRLVAQIAAETGLSADAVRERLVAATVLDPARSYFRVGAADDPLPEGLLRDWYLREGFTVEQVAALTGTTARQVRYRLKRYRLSAGRPGPAPRLRRRLTEDVLTRLYVREGQSCAQIAAGAGASTEAVRELLIAYGIARRPSGNRPRRPAADLPAPGPAPYPAQRQEADPRLAGALVRARAAQNRSALLLEQARETLRATEEIRQQLRATTPKRDEAGRP